VLGAWLLDSLHAADRLGRNVYVNLDRSGSDGGGAARTSPAGGGVAGERR
jgi:hypothetical protein